VEPSQLVLESLRTDEEFALYRGEHSNQPGSPSVLLLAPGFDAASAGNAKKDRARILARLN
jgi:hypothetical protein